MATTFHGPSPWPHPRHPHPWNPARCDRPPRPGRANPDAAARRGRPRRQRLPRRGPGAPDLPGRARVLRRRRSAGAVVTEPARQCHRHRPAGGHRLPPTPPTAPPSPRRPWSLPTPPTLSPPCGGSSTASTRSPRSIIPSGERRYRGLARLVTLGVSPVMCRPVVLASRSDAAPRRHRSTFTFRGKGPTTTQRLSLCFPQGTAI